MSQNIPAWKKIGLKIKEDVQDDPIALTSHIEDVNLTNKQAKKLNKQKRKLEESKNEDKKAPKRVKLPKSERAPPPEKDQLAYLRQYENDKLNWKFSKQKQNWILKNIKNIPSNYESALQVYLEGLQGGSRKRVVDDLLEVIKKWNKAAEEAEARVEREIQRQLNGETTNDEDSKSEEEENTDGNKKTKGPAKEQEEVAPDYEYAKRCGVLVKILTDEDVELKGIQITDADIKIGVKDQEKEPSSEEKNIQPEEDEKEEESMEDKTQDNLIIEEVEVAGLSNSDNHLNRVELNKDKFNDFAKQEESHETFVEYFKPLQEPQTNDEGEEKSKKRKKDKSKDLSDGKVKKSKKDKKEKKKDKKKSKD